MGPIKEFRDLLAQYSQLACIDEFRTSQICSNLKEWKEGDSLCHCFCDGKLEKALVECEKATKEGEENLSWRPHAIKHCPKCSTVSSSTYSVS